MTTDSELADESGDLTVASAPQLERAGRLLAVAAVLAIGAATLLPQSGQPETTPFCIVCGVVGGVDFLLNVLLFLPLGVGLAMSGLRASHALLVIIALSTGIELAQLFWISGRDATVGDVIANTLGGCFGLVLARTSDVWRAPKTRGAIALCLGWCAIWLALQTFSSYGFAVALPSSHYYGQIARVFANMAPFKGNVLSATIDTIVVPDYGYSKTAQIRAAVERGATVAATVVPGGPTPKIAPILRVADEKQREILNLAQDNQALVFAVRTGAQVLRLRPPHFAMRAVFPRDIPPATPASTEPLRVAATDYPDSVLLVAQSAKKQLRQNFRVSSALGWTLIFPKQWYVEATRSEAVISFLWLALLALPFGYWFFCIMSPRRSYIASALMLFVFLATTFIGLIVIPQRLGLGAATRTTWLATSCGVIAGAVIAYCFAPIRGTATAKTDERGKRVASPRPLSSL